MTKRRSTAQLQNARAALAASDALGDRDAVAPTDEIADDVTGRYWLVTQPRIRLAIEVALATGRPLLVEGDPGTGKSTLARAVAVTLGWRYLEVTVTSRTLAQDLLWEVDHLRRLKDAQLGGTEAAARVDDEGNYVQPGVLWWAYDPGAATRLPGAPRIDPCPEPVDAPAVVLVDEIDKADPEVPDNLLVPLGTLRFKAGHGVGEVAAVGDCVPLVVITSNRERDLSAPFLRRCVKLYLETPPAPKLVEIALGHLGHDEQSVNAVEAARDVLLGGESDQTPASLSTAEFIDAARAARELGLDRDDPAWQEVRRLLEGHGDELAG